MDTQAPGQYGQDGPGPRSPIAAVNTGVNELMAKLQRVYEYTTGVLGADAPPEAKSFRLRLDETKETAKTRIPVAERRKICEGNLSKTEKALAKPSGVRPVRTAAAGGGQKDPGTKVQNGGNTTARAST